MPKYTFNYIVSGNISIEFNAKNDKEAIKKLRTQKRFKCNRPKFLEENMCFLSIYPTVLETEDKRIIESCQDPSLITEELC